jgi:peroxiredoxin
MSIRFMAAGSVGVFLSGLLAGHAALALDAGAKVDNFRLNDHQGNSHELYYLSDAKAVVLLAHGSACQASLNAARDLQALRAHYQTQGVVFFGLDSNLADSREAVAAAAAKAGIDLPVLMDPTQLIGEALGLARNGEALVINPKNWTLAYRGNPKDLAAALDATLQGGKIDSNVASGCALAMPERVARAAHAGISYSKTIAPILLDKCVACHRQGGIGPWAMLNYDLVRGFAPMIREVLRTQRMPPWHADPHYQAFSNDRSLTDAQVKTVVHWIEAGAPRGTGEDPLLTQPKNWPQWTLGQPDLVITTPPVNVPATGIVPYQHVDVANPLDHDVWIRAIDYLPGERSVLHHVIASAGGGRGFPASLNNYVPGAGPLVIPAGNGILLKKGTKFNFQMHYTPNGKAATDSTRLGLYFMKDPPKYNYRAMILANPRLKIPANTKSHTEQAENVFKQDVLVYSVHPHSHFRGKAAKFVARLPDGTEEVLLNVPHYDFNWQSTYDLAEPKRLPAGTRIVYTTEYDNSAQNKANPDPNRTVTWGEQSWDEMIFGVLRYRLVNEDGSDNSPAISFPDAPSASTRTRAP